MWAEKKPPCVLPMQNNEKTAGGEWKHREMTGLLCGHLVWVKLWSSAFTAHPPSPLQQLPHLSCTISLAINKKPALTQMVSAERSQAAERSERLRWQSTQGWPLRRAEGWAGSAVNSHTALDGLTDRFKQPAQIVSGPKCHQGDTHSRLSLLI